MYWACFNHDTGVAAVISSAIDPWEASEEWDATLCYDNRADAETALNEWREQTAASTCRDDGGDGAGA